MKSILWLILTIAAWLILIPSSKAADYLITCNDSGCTSGGQALFDGVLVAPGESVTRSLEIVNNDNEQINVNANAAKKSSTDEDFINFVSVVVADVGGPVRFSGSAADFLGQTIDLGTVAAGKVKAIDFTISLADVGNEYQAKKINFNLPINLSVPGGGGGTTSGTTAAASPSPSPVGFAAGVFTGLESLVLGVGASPSPSPAAGVVAGQASFPWWWPIPLILFPLLLFWYLGFRRMKA